MDSDLLDGLVRWALLPAVVIAGAIVTLLLRLPQLARLPEAFRAINAFDPKAEGRVHPATAIALSTALTVGAGAVVSAATAISLGGPGALAWLWLFGLLVAPLRLAETLLARTSPPGKAGKKAREDGSLAARLAADADTRVAMLGNALFVLAPIAAVLAIGGLHGPAVVDAADQLLPGSAEPIGFGVAAAAALFAFFGRDKAWLGWTALLAIVVLVAACLVTIFFDAGRAFGAIAAAFDDVFSGMPTVRSFSGALAGEIAAASLSSILPVIAAPAGVDGSLSSLAQPRSVKAYASAAMLPVLAHVAIGTLVGMAIGATQAHVRLVEGTRHLSELRFYDSAFETVSQRMEPERAWHGFVRVIDGRAAATPLELGTERGMIEEPMFEEADGSPGNFAVRVEAGEIDRVLRPDADGALRDAPMGDIDRIVVRGRMLPTRGALFAAAMSRGGGDVASRGALAALMLLAALGAAAAGLALARAFRARVSDEASRAISAVPAIALVLGVTSAAHSLAALAVIAVVITNVAVAVALIARSRELVK
jgi:AGCS family alanine or glycine:cation symporter